MIRYFVPADGDDPAHPNVFHLPSGLVGSGEVRCADVRKHFPLPGQYHFRFKKAFRDSYVWVDMTDDETVVRSCEGVFTAKVTRLSDGRKGDSQALPPPPQPQQMGMPPSVRGGIEGSGGGGGVGGGGDDLLNMGHGSHGSSGGGGTAPVPGPGLMGGLPDDLLGMGVFESAPAGGNVATARTMPPHSPPLHPTPMTHMAGGVGGVGVGGFGGGSLGTQWQQHQQQQQFARFPPPGRRGL